MQKMHIGQHKVVRKPSSMYNIITDRLFFNYYIMNRIIIDTVGAREESSSGFKRSKGLPVQIKGGNTEIYYGIEDIEQEDFNRDYQFSVPGTNNAFKLLYVTNTKEYFTTLKKQISKNKIKEYYISAFNLESFKENLKNCLIVNGILMD